MSKPSEDIQYEIRDLLNKHKHEMDNGPWSIISDLEFVMESKDGPEFVRLMQKWMAST